MKNKTKQLIYILISVLFLFTSCEKMDLPEGTPRSIKRKIKSDKENTCLESVYEYEYKGEKVYYFMYPCPEGCYILLDENADNVKQTDGNTVCSCNWGGAYCSEYFFENRSNERIIWQKDND